MGPMRRFMQTFILARQTPKMFYVHNDIFRYQDEVFHDLVDGSCADVVDSQAISPGKWFALSVDSNFVAIGDILLQSVVSTLPSLLVCLTLLKSYEQILMTYFGSVQVGS